MTTALLAILSMACASEPAPTVEDWEGAGIEPICDPGGARVTGEVEEQPIDLTVVENYGYQVYPALWAVLFDDGFRMTVVPHDLGLSAVGWAQGVFVLGADEPLLCGTHGTKISADPPRGRLRTLTSLGVCPGTEAIAGTIEGCLDPNRRCVITGGPLPAGGREETGWSFSQDWLEVTFQMRLAGGEVFDFDSERAGGTVFYEGEVVCVGDATVETDDTGAHAFTFGALTRLGRCDEGEPVGGFVNVCLPQS